MQFELEKYKRIIQNQDHNIILNDSPIDGKKHIDLNYLFSDKNGLLIAQYLDHRDILNMRLINRFINHAIMGRSQFFVLAGKSIKRKILNDQKDLKKRFSILFANLFNKLDYWNEIVSTIPEYFVKHVFAKYILLKETIGEYILKSIHQAEDIYELILEAEGLPL